MHDGPSQSIVRECTFEERVVCLKGENVFEIQRYNDGYDGTTGGKATKGDKIRSRHPIMWVEGGSVDTTLVRPGALLPERFIGS